MVKSLRGEERCVWADWKRVYVVNKQRLNNVIVWNELTKFKSLHLQIFLPVLLSHKFRMHHAFLPCVWLPIECCWSWWVDINAIIYDDNCTQLLVPRRACRARRYSKWLEIYLLNSPHRAAGRSVGWSVVPYRLRHLHITFPGWACQSKNGKNRIAKRVVNDDTPMRWCPYVNGFACVERER